MPTKLVSAMTGNPFMFEAQTCSRCGESGHYSYCQRYGTRCFGCGGHGIKLTKRGAAAQEYYRALLSKQIGELECGDKIMVDAGPFNRSGWATVESVEHGVPGGKFRIGDGEWQQSPGQVRVNARMSDGTGYGFTQPGDKLIRIAQTGSQKAAAKADALAFQATLTKQGKPRKTRSTR